MFFSSSYWARRTLGKRDMIPFFSERNQVYGTVWNNQPAAEKHFSLHSDWEAETSLYSALDGTGLCPRVLNKEPGRLVTEYLPDSTLLAELERQERSAFSPAPWLALVRWLRNCQAVSGRLPREGELRDFLWNASTGRVVGLDLESFAPIEASACGAELIAGLLGSSLSDTPAKRMAAALLAEKLEVPAEAVETACQSLEARHGERRPRPLTGIVLAGGQSKRMGRNKAELELCGMTLLERQAEKLWRLGANEILLSGEHCPALPDCRVVPDEYSGRGPLGGIHACLKEAQNACCLVLSVDVPLVPLSALAHLCRYCGTGAVVLRHGAFEEPLIGVYSKDIAPEAEALIRRGGVPVRSLRSVVDWNVWEYLGPKELMRNCNTAEEFSRVQERAALHVRYGLPF